MSEKVIVVTEAEADWLAAHIAPESEISGTAQGIYDKVNLALSRDPDALIEQVARAIASQDRRNYTDGFERDFNLPEDYTDAEWERELKVRKEASRASARAALAAITREGKD